MTPTKIAEALSILVSQLNEQVGKIEVPEEYQYMLDAARSRVLDLNTILGAITGNGVPFLPQMRPMSWAIDRFMKSLEEQYMQPIPEDAPDLEDQLLTRDEIEQLVNQARLSALSFLAHTNACFILLPRLKRVK